MDKREQMTIKHAKGQPMRVNHAEDALTTEDNLIAMTAKEKEVITTASVLFHETNRKVC